MTTKRMQAKCLCGGVRIDADFTEIRIAVCHCDICRRWCGGPFMAVEDARNVVVAGTDSVSVYESSSWGERAFCRRCGSALYFRAKDDSLFAISAMAFDGMDDAKLSDEIFIDSKPSWYDLANDTRKLTGAEALAQSASDEDRPHG